MTLAELQAYAGKLCAKYPDANTERCGLAIAEEAGEVCRAILKRALGIRGSYEHWTREIGLEAGDLVCTIFMLATIEGFDLDQILTVRVHELLNRSVDHDPIT